MIFKNILLAYQLENYSSLRFLRFIYSHPRFWISGSKRQTLDWTEKAKLIFLLSSIFFVLSNILIVFRIGENLLFILFLPFCFLTLPCYFLFSHALLYPLDVFLKHRIISQAKKKLALFPKLKVIAITGSMGKTTTKEILKTTLGQSFVVLATQGTKNTPLGISRLILKELNTSHEICIIEMGAYHKGNIAELCSIIQPHISIITGITLQHLERFGSLDEIIDTKFEILECLPEDGFAVIDTTTLGVQKGLAIKKLQVQNRVYIEKNLPYTYKDDLSGMVFQYGSLSFDTKLLAPYIGKTLQICFEVGRYLGQSLEDFQKAVQKIDFVEHRMQFIKNPQTGVSILDDSFNGNIEGIENICELLQNAPFQGRKIVVAGGVVELGEKSDEVNQEMGKKLAGVSDMLLLVEGPVGNALEEGAKSEGFENIKKYPDPLSLHGDLKNIIRAGDFVIFQNDLPDTYL